MVVFMFTPFQQHQSACTCSNHDMPFIVQCTCTCTDVEKPPLDPALVDLVKREAVEALGRGPTLEDQRRDTLIATDASLVTDSIIRGNHVMCM